MNAYRLCSRHISRNWGHSFPHCALSTTSASGNPRYIRGAHKRRSPKGNENDESLPDFPSLLRKFYLKIHPDLLRAKAPLEADLNDSSMKDLNGVLSTLKGYNEYPAAMNKQITFYMTVKGSDDLQKITLTLRTAGGDCKRLLMKIFEEFFARTGIHSGSFRWGGEYFPSNPKDL